MSVLAVGFIVLTLLSIGLFFARLYCRMTLTNLIFSDPVRIEPSLLVPPQIEDDPNVVIKSSATAYFKRLGIFSLLGPVDYSISKGPTLGKSPVYYYDFKEKNEWIYLDQKTGLIHCKTVPGTAELYAGPNGVSETPTDALGRFHRPIAYRTWHYHDPWTIYDKKHRRFFAVDFDQRNVKTGPQLAENDPHEPTQIGHITKNSELLFIDWLPPEIEVSKEQAEKERYYSRSEGKYYISAISTHFFAASPYLLVLDKSGRIDLLDRESLTFTGTAGYLPAPQTFFASKQKVTPKDLSDYEVLPLATKQGGYEGMCVASVNRQGTTVALAAFDADGKNLKTEYSTFSRHLLQGPGHETPISSTEAFYSISPWAPLSTTLNRLFENLQPPVLSLAAYFTADCFEAVSGYRAIFILPNSFISTLGRGISGNEIIKFFKALWTVALSLILSAFLSWRVGIDANKVGLSQNAKLLWLIGTFAFGLAAYITYRLTKPKITLVTCQNCGNLRRPDMENCHRCNSAWKIPELTAPTWRVID
jgi:hypothetical protein